jgi:hypothetical protein
MMRQAPQGVAMPGATANVASFGGGMPAGATSYSVVSVSNGSSTCTRTTEVVPQGNGKPAKVVSNVSGDCGPSAAPAQPSAPAQSSAPIDRT